MTEVKSSDTSSGFPRGLCQETACTSTSPVARVVESRTMKYSNVEEEVVISGIGCKLPESQTMEEFAEKLFGGVNMVTRDDRKLSQGLFENLPEYSGKIRDTRKFDHTFFGIPNIVVQCMDPMTQQIMERTFEAVLDAGINPCDLRGTDTAVFSGTSISDFDLEWATNYRGGYGIMGRNRCMNANRISYWLDLKGTSVSQDSTWTNGFTNLMNGWDYVRKGRCDTALVSTANLQSNAEIAIQLNDLGFLSPNGVCRSFDDSANGYSRSDAVVVFVLQRASLAKRSYATIAHIFAKCYGDRDNTIYRPLQSQWEDLFHEFYSDSKIDVNDISYIEGHGSGIKVEDAIELKAIANFFCRKRRSPLLIGSVKSNMGHAEASAASCSLIKALIALERGIIPQNINFTSPNSEVSYEFQTGKLKLVDKNTPLPENSLVAVNSHGFGGIYAHIVLKRNPKDKVARFDGIPRLVLVAGRTNELMDNVLNKLESMPFDPEYISLLNEINSKKLDKYLGRGYTILPKKEGTVIHDHQTNNEMKRPLWFIFSGMGSQWPKMGRRLMTLPIFRESIEKSHKILQEKGLDLIKIITDDDPKIFENILHSFVGIAAVQIALVDILNALNIVPDGMIGHSVGELGCAYADGCFTAEQMILSAYSRGRASIESDLIKGYMAAIGKGYNDIKDELPEGIEVACHNASDSCTISGPAAQVQDYVKTLESKKIFARTVNVSNIAYHSRYIKPAAPRLLKYLKEVIPNPKLRSSKWISTSNKEENWDTDLAKYCSAEYHTNNLLSSVLFEEGCKHIPSNAICIEIAPHGLLQAILKRSLGEECTNIPLTHRTSEDPLIFLLQAIGKLFMAGLEPQIANIYPKVEYPVSRNTPSIHQLIYWDHEIDLMIAQTRAEKKVIYSIKSHFFKTAPDSIGYIINGENTYPTAVFLHLVWSIFAALKKMKTEECPVLVENLRMERRMIIHPSKNDDAMITLQKGTGDFEINAAHLIARGNITMLSENTWKDETSEVPCSSSYTMTKDEIYNEFQRKGYDIGENFKVLDSLHINREGWKGEIDAAADWVQTIESLLQIQILQMGEESICPKIPKSVEKIYIYPQQHLKMKNSSDSKTLRANYDIIQNVIKCGGLKMKGFTVKELPFSKSTLKYTNKNFVPFMYPPFKNIREYLDFCFSIVVDNVKPLSAENDIKVLEFGTGNDMDWIGQYLEESFSHFKVRVCKASRTQELDMENFDFVVCPFSNIDQCVDYVDESGFIMTTMARGQLVRTAVGLEVISRWTASDHEEALLFRKKFEPKDEAEFITIPKNEAILINVLQRLKGSARPIYLVGTEEPERGLDNFKKRMQAETPFSLRWIFLLEENSSSGENYKNQVKNGLVTNIFYKGKWGFFLQKNFSEKPLLPRLLNVKNFSKDMVECYLGVDVSEVLTDLKKVEFSGRLGNGTRVIGVATVSDDLSIVRDKYFSWSLPEGWTIEDGATVPLSYVFAYYCIVLVGNLQYYEGLLITDACTPLGIASVEVGLSLIPKVFVTVSNEEEARIIRNRFPSLPRDNIILHENKNFHIELGIATNGKYPELIINQLESERLMSTVNCLSSFGRIFHFGSNDYKKNVQLGTSVFLLSTSFYSMSQDTINKLRDEDKDKIRNLINCGLKDGVVKPLPRKIFTLGQLQKLLREPETIPKMEKYIFAVDTFNAERNCLQIESDCSYLIIADDSDVWSDVMLCLINKGARKIVVTHSGNSKSAEKCAKIIENYDIVIREHKNFLNIESVFSEARKLGPLAAVFVIALKSGEAAGVVEKVDGVYQDENGHLLVLSKEGGISSEICRSRNQRGLTSTNFIWRAENALITAEMELISNVCGKDPVIYVSHALKGALDSDSKDKMLRAMLPSSIREFCNLGSSLGNGVRVTELPFQGGMGRTDLKELSPLIFIGGLQNDLVEMLLPLAKDLIYPCYCLHLPRTNMSIKQIASFALPKIFELTEKSGVVNLIGISWGCYVAIETTRQIEELGRNVGLILVDCPHHTLKQSLSENVHWESDVLNVIQGFSKTIDGDTFTHEKTWSSKVDRIMSTLNLGKEDQDNFKEAANYIHGRISALLNYDLTGIKLLGPLTVIKSGPQSPDDRTISKLCNCIFVRSVPVGSRQSLTCKELRDIIHGSAVTPAMSEGTVHSCSWRNLEDFLVQQKLMDFNNLRADFRVTATKLKFSFTH